MAREFEFTQRRQLLDRRTRKKGRCETLSDDVIAEFLAFQNDGKWPEDLKPTDGGPLPGEEVELDAGGEGGGEGDGTGAPDPESKPTGRGRRGRSSQADQGD